MADGEAGKRIGPIGQLVATLRRAYLILLLQSVSGEHEDRTTAKPCSPRLSASANWRTMAATTWQVCSMTTGGEWFGMWRS